MLSSSPRSRTMSSGRDLTINALFYDMDTGEVVDYVGGIDDIKDGVIRAVGNPAERFDEDKLRILRAVRFAGRTGSELDPETRDAILADNDLEEVSAERTTKEFVKGIQSAQDVTHFLGMMEDLGLFSQVFPGLQVGLSGGKTKDHVVQIAAMLSGNDPNKVKEQLQKMKYSRADAETIKHLIELQALERGSASSLKKEFKRLRVNPERVIEFAKLVDGFPPKRAKGFIKFAQSPPAVNPRDLMAKGLRGPDIGKAVKGAEEDAYEKLVSEIRRQVRALLKEDATGFTKELATSDKFGDQFFGGSLNKDQGREIKRAFNKHADHQFLSTLDTVHWGLSPSALEQLKGKRRDEISTTMTLPGDDFIAPFEYGLWVKGRITLATNNQDMLYSGFYGDYGPGYEGTEEEVSHRDRSSGRNKRPSTSKDYSGYKQLVHGNEFHEKMARKGLPYVLDKSTWNPASVKDHGTPTYNEALVDNWQPVGIVIKPGMGMLQAGPAVIRDLATKFGVPIYDTSRRILWTPS